MQEKILAYLKKVMTFYDLPGLAAGVVKDGEVFLTQGFGVGELGKEQPVCSRSLFHMASVSKLFVATGIIQLAEQGKVNLDDPFCKHLPDFKMKDPRFAQVTLRQLLNHTSGMPDVMDYNWHNPQFDEQALQRTLDSMAGMALIFDPGSRFTYSNYAYEILGGLLARVYGMSFEEVIRKQILDPLGMQKSTFLKTEVDHALGVKPHIHSWKNVVSAVYPYNRAHGPSSTLHSNVDEMCRWAIANLQRGELQGERILQPETYDLMWTITADIGRNLPFAQEMGLGWFLGEKNGVRTVGHSGHDTGFQSHLVLLPQQSSAAVLLCNAAPIPLGKILSGVVDILLGVEPEIPAVNFSIELGKAYEINGISGMEQRLSELETLQTDPALNLEDILTLGDGLMEDQKLDQAGDLIGFVIQKEPQNAKAYELMAKLSFFRGDMQAAAKYAQKSLELNPDNPGLMAQVRMLAG